MKKINLRNKNGITLIALVVTIIVLIILAGISISLVLGNNGIITKSRDAKEKTLSSREEESAKLTFTEVQMELAQGKTVDTTIFQTMIDNNFGAGNATGAVGGESYIITVNSTGNNYSMDSSGNISTLEELPIDLNPGVLEGSGTTSDPYVINSIEDLVALSYDVNTGANLYEDKLVTLGRDLDFNEDSSYANANAKYKYVGESGCTPDSTSETTIKSLMTNTEGVGFTPIGVTNGSNIFKGNFDGKGKGLTNLYIKGISNGGVFGCISTDMAIRNLKLVDCNIESQAYTGGIVGLSKVKLTMSGCSVNGTIKGIAPSGGIVGQNSGTITVTNSEIIGGTVSAQSCTGGFIGQNNGTLEIYDCYNKATVSSSNASAGGIVGVGSGIIGGCYNTGKINSSASSSGIGGILGQSAGNMEIYNCYNTGNIGEETTSARAGGIVGEGNTKIINCCNNGIITSKNPAGGIIGGISTSPITNCYNFNNVTSSSLAGGIIGSGSNTTIDNCYNIGKIISNSVPAGGIAGTGATITNSNNTGEVSGGSQYITGYIIGQGTVDNTNKYLKQNPDILANGAVEFESEEEMNETMDVEKFVHRMNTYDVFTGGVADAVAFAWKIKDGFPVPVIF